MVINQDSFSLRRKTNKQLLQIVRLRSQKMLRRKTRKNKHHSLKKRNKLRHKIENHRLIVILAAVVMRTLIASVEKM